MRAGLVAGFVVLACGVAGCRARADRKGIVVLPDMLESAAWESYDPDPLRAVPAPAPPPPEGTVAMGAEAFPYGTGEEEALRAGIELRNPYVPSAETIARGRVVYERICFVCHGPGGDGDGPIIGLFPNPPSLHAEHARQLPDGRIFHIITRGQGVMPSHALQVLPADRWRVILYVRQLQQAGVPTPVAGGGSP